MTFNQPDIAPAISREELREFLINNRLVGTLKEKVEALKKEGDALSNYQAVEMIMDFWENSIS